MAIAPSFSDERLLLAIKEVEESNPASLGVVYTDYEYRFALAIADAKANLPPNLALYTDCEYRFGAAIADIRTGASLRWNLYTPTEVFFAQSIMPLIDQGNTVNITTANTVAIAGTLPSFVSQDITTANTVAIAGTLPSFVSQDITTANTVAIAATLTL